MTFSDMQLSVNTYLRELKRPEFSREESRVQLLVLTEFGIIRKSSMNKNTRGLSQDVDKVLNVSLYCEMNSINVFIGFFILPGYQYRRVFEM
jgi:hypothetical protein